MHIRNVPGVAVGKWIKVRMKSQTSIGDKELLLGLQRGDELSFTTLYNRYSPSVYLSIIKLVKEREVALDIVQDLFFNIWKNRQAIDVNRPFRPYIYRIAKNLVVDVFRKAAKDRRITDELIASTLTCDEHTEKMVLGKETALLLNQTIHSLPSQQRKIFTLCRIDGRSYEEVAEMLHLSIATIGNQLSRATKKIRQQLVRNHFSQLVFLFIILKIWLP